MPHEAITMDAGGHEVFIGPDVLTALERYLSGLGPAARIFILGDENTLEHCLPELNGRAPRTQDAELIVVPPGESSKSVFCCQHIWQELAGHAAERSSVLLNLGGGVVTDLGGFAGATFKRGISTINIPTSLMGMVDAAIGGKTAIDLGGVKNVVGVFHDPVKVYVHVPFLRTLGKRELLNGVAEMLKHALIRDQQHWNDILEAPLHDMDALTRLIARSITIKAAIVKEDPRESSSRKLLNFGHTIGHGIESFSWEAPTRSLLHGEAVAMGMVCESWLSWRMGLLEREAYLSIQEHLFSLFRPYPIDSTGHHRILELMRNDKKNSEGQFRMTLLTAIGSAEHDVRVSAVQVQEALEQYHALVEGGKVKN